MFGSELSEANNEPTLRLHHKSWQKNRKLFLAQNCLNRIMSQLLDYTKKTKKIENKIEKLSMAQNCLKRIMSQLLDYTKKDKKSRKKSKSYFWLRIVWSE